MGQSERSPVPHLPYVVANSLQFDTELQEESDFKNFRERRQAGLEVNVEADSANLYLSLRDTKEGIMEGLKRMQAMLTSPLFPESELKAVISEMKEEMLSAWYSLEGSRIQ